MSIRQTARSIAAIARKEYPRQWVRITVFPKSSDNVGPIWECDGKCTEGEDDDYHVHTEIKSYNAKLTKKLVYGYLALVASPFAFLAGAFVYDKIQRHRGTGIYAPVHY